jgi:hypothetical protein
MISKQFFKKRIDIFFLSKFAKTSGQFQLFTSQCDKHRSMVPVRTRVWAYGLGAYKK